MPHVFDMYVVSGSQTVSVVVSVPFTESSNTSVASSRNVTVSIRVLPLYKHARSLRNIAILQLSILRSIVSSRLPSNDPSNCEWISKVEPRYCML